MNQIENFVACRFITVGKVFLPEGNSSALSSPMNLDVRDFHRNIGVCFINIFLVLLPFCQVLITTFKGFVIEVDVRLYLL